MASGAPEIIGGYLLGYLGLATLQAMVALAEVLRSSTSATTRRRCSRSSLVVWLLAIASVMLGIFVSTFARRESQVLPFIPLVIVPSVFLSGFLVAMDRLPMWAQAVGQLIPLYYANAVIQEVIRPTGALSHVGGHLLALAGYSVILLLAASRTLREVE